MMYWNKNLKRNKRKDIIDAGLLEHDFRLGWVEKQNPKAEVD